MLATFGEGSAEIDLRLDHHRYRAGEEIEGHFFLKGGTVEQQINGIEITLILTARDGKKGRRFPITAAPISSSFRLAPEKEKMISFSLRLPHTLPISGPEVSYHFSTRLDIPGGIDPIDTDPIEILPPEPLQFVFNALEELGFKEQESSGAIDGQAQEFAFSPTSTFLGTIEEVELLARVEKNGLRLFLEVDLLSRRYKEIEIVHELFLEETLLQNTHHLTEHLKNILEQIIHNPKKFQGDKRRKDTYEGLFGSLGEIRLQEAN
jgi:sporulation-control protein